MSRGHEEGGDNSGIYHSHHHTHKELDVSWAEQKISWRSLGFDTFAIYFLSDLAQKSFKISNGKI